MRAATYTYAWTGWNPTPDRRAAIEALAQAVADQPDPAVRAAMMRLIPMPSGPVMDPSDPASWRRERNLMIPVAGYQKNSFPLYRARRATSGVGTVGWPGQDSGDPPPLMATIGLEYTATRIRVADLTLSSGDTITRTTLDAVPLTAMAADMALQQCLVDRWDVQHLPSATILADGALLVDPLTRPSDLHRPATGPTPEPVLIDSTGKPWWRARLAHRAPEVSKPGRRRRMTPAALQECWAVYQQARSEGRGTTAAVEEWLEFAGSPPGYPSMKTVERWIAEAKKHQGVK